MTQSVCIIGGGPVGCALAVSLRSVGLDVDIYERYQDIRLFPPPAGRSINLVLTNRGLRLAHDLGVGDELVKSTVRVSGRSMHSTEGNVTYQPYGRSGECNYSIDRSLLNKFWLSEAERRGCRILFDYQVMEFNVAERSVHCRHSNDSSSVIDLSRYQYVFGADGGGSIIRRGLAKAGLVSATEDMLSAGYKEVCFPAGEDGAYLMDPNALHIWARKSHMLMALANTDGSFTGTIFMDKIGEPSFETCCSNQEGAEAFWIANFLDAFEMTDKKTTLSNFVSSPVGILGTVRCSPWYGQLGSVSICLIGDAAHAIVPFFGQGVNCGFEDVFVLRQLMMSHQDLGQAMEVFGTIRKRDSDAIANLALENHEEMRSRVADPFFMFLKKLDAFVMDVFPRKYRTRYTLIMYSHNSYSVCQEIGEVIAEFLHKIVEKFSLGPDSDLGKEVDLTDLERMIDEYITPSATKLGVSFEF